MGVKRRVRSSALFHLGFVVLLACLSSCSGSQPATDAADVRTFKLGLIPGAQEFVDFVMERHGILEAAGLRAEKVKSLSPANLHLMVAEREVDIGFGGFTTMAAARAEGKDIIVVYGVFSPVNVVFVRNDSPLQSLTDLKGKKLGIFGGPGSTTFTFLAVLARRWYALDLFNEDDVQLVSAPAPALIDFLDRGEVDAALLGTTESIQMQASGRFRPLVDLSGEYRSKQGGRAPAHVTVATNETFAAAHPDIVRDYLKAFAQTVDFISAHPQVYEEYADSIEMKDPAERALLREKLGQNLTRVWDADQVAVQHSYLQLVQQSAPDVLKQVPDGLMRNDFLP